MALVMLVNPQWMIMVPVLVLVLVLGGLGSSCPDDQLHAEITASWTSGSYSCFSE